MLLSAPKSQLSCNKLTARQVNRVESQRRWPLSFHMRTLCHGGAVELLGSAILPLAVNLALYSNILQLNLVDLASLASSHSFKREHRLVGIGPAQ